MLRKIRRSLMLVTMLLVWWAQTAAVWSVTVIEARLSAQQEPRQFVLVLVDLLREADLQQAELQGFRRSAEAGGIGLLSGTLADTPLLNPKKTESQLVTRDGQTSTGNSVEAEYRVQTGHELQQNTWCENCTNRQSDLRIGELLALHQVDRLFIGDQDAFFWVMDKSGAGNRLDTRQTYRNDPIFPGGRRFNVSEVLQEVGRTKPARNSFVVIEFDEFKQIEQAHEQLAPQQFDRFRREALHSLNLLGEDLLQQAGAQTTVLLASTRTSLHGKNRELAPIALVGGSIPRAGLLTSETTKRQGIVSRFDVAATVLEFFQIPKPSGMSGKPIAGILHGADSWDFIQQLAAKTKQTYALRPLIYGLLGGMAVLSLLLAGVLFVVRGRQWGLPLHSLFFWAATAVLTAPLVWFVMPVSAQYPNWVWGLQVSGGTMGVVWVLLHIRNLYRRLLVLASSFASVLLFDAWTGGDLAHQSVFSYDPIVGIRYYGMGNEYMGLLISWSFLGCGYLLTMRPHLQKWGIWLLAGIGIGLIGLFAAPQWGGNAGGSLTAAATLAAILSFAVQKHKQMTRSIPFLIVASAFGLLFWLNPAQANTHISEAYQLLLTGQWQALVSIVERKLAMNLSLMNLTVGTFGVLIIVTIILVSVFTLTDRHPLGSVSKAASIGAVTGLLVNDSGVVVAVMMFLPIIYSLLMVRIAAGIPILHTVVPTCVSQLDEPDVSVETKLGR